MNAIDYEIGETSGGHRGASEAVIAGDVESLRPLPRISVHAFCVSDLVYRVMEQCATDRRMARVSMRAPSKLSEITDGARVPGRSMLTCRRPALRHTLCTRSGSVAPAMNSSSIE